MPSYRVRFSVLARAALLVGVVTAANLWIGGRAWALVPSAPVPAVTTVTTAARGSIGEPAAAASPGGELVAATSFDGEPEVEVWTRKGAASGWASPVRIMPPGFTRSYDPSTAPTRSGFVVVSGASRGGKGACLGDGSIFATRFVGGVASTSVLVDGSVGANHVDDRPTVATGPNATVWAGWSERPTSQECNVAGGTGPTAVAVSLDGGETFSSPLLITPPVAGNTFGVQIRPLGQHRAVVAYSVVSADQPATVSVGLAVVALGPAGLQLVHQSVVVFGPALPATLAGGTFYAYSNPGLALLPRSQAAVIVPVLVDGRSELKVASGGLNSSNWSDTELLAPGDDSLLLANLIPVSARALLVMAAEFRPSNGTLSYLDCQLPLSNGGVDAQTCPMSLVAGPTAESNYGELGEETPLSYSLSQKQVVSALVAGNPAGLSLELVAWSTGSLARSTPAGTTSTSLGRISAEPIGHSAGQSRAASTFWPVLAVVALTPLVAGIVKRRRAVLRRRARRSPPGGRPLLPPPVRPRR
jgi:hypothetical protein